MNNILKLYCDRAKRSEGAIKLMSSSRFSRKVPTLKNLIPGRMYESMRCGLPFNFIGLYGGSKICKPATDRAGKPEQEFVAFVSTLKNKIETESDYKSNFTLLFCDMHHHLANGVEFEKTQTYFESLKPMTDKINIQVTKLSDIISKEADIYAYTDMQSVNRAQDIISKNNVNEKLAQAAKKHAKKVGIEIPSYEDAARIYMEIELFFLSQVDMINKNLPIFFSFSDPAVQSPIALAAEVPMLHFYISTDGKCGVPWYKANI